MGVVLFAPVPPVPADTITWELMDRVELPADIRFVRDATWDSESRQVFGISASGVLFSVAWDQGYAAIRNLGDGYGRISVKEDTIVVSHAADQSLLLLAPRSRETVRSLDWRQLGSEMTQIASSEARLFPVSFLSDQTVWAGFLGGEGAASELPRMILTEEGAPVRAVGKMTRVAGWLNIQDPNGRVPQRLNVIHPLEFASYAAASKGGRFTTILNQRLSAQGVGCAVDLTVFDVERQTTTSHSVHCSVRTVTEAMRQEVADQIVLALPADQRDHVANWAAYALRSVEVEPYSSGVQVNDRGEVWIRRDANPWGSRVWDVVSGSGDIQTMRFPSPVEVIHAGPEKIMTYSGSPATGYSVEMYIAK